MNSWGNYINALGAAQQVQFAQRQSMPGASGMIAQPQATPSPSVEPEPSRLLLLCDE